MQIENSMQRVVDWEVQNHKGPSLKPCKQQIVSIEASLTNQKYEWHHASCDTAAAEESSLCAQIHLVPCQVRHADHHNRRSPSSSRRQHRSAGCGVFGSPSSPGSQRRGSTCSPPCGGSQFCPLQRRRLCLCCRRRSMCWEGRGTRH